MLCLGAQLLVLLPNLLQAVRLDAHISQPRLQNIHDDGNVAVS
jgi:hypothetical protein